MCMVVAFVDVVLSTICKAVAADRSGIAVFGRYRTKPCAFSHKVAPGVDGGNLVCATGFADLISDASSTVK